MEIFLQAVPDDSYVRTFPNKVLPGDFTSQHYQLYQSIMDRADYPL